MNRFTCALAFSVPSRPAWDAGPTAPATHRAAGASASARVLAAAIALAACRASCARRGWRVPRLPLPPPARPPHPRPGSCRPRCAHPSCRHEWSSPRQRNHPRWPRRGVAAETADPAHPTNWREACPSRCSGTDVAPPERRNKAAQSDSPRYVWLGQCCPGPVSRSKAVGLQGHASARAETR